MSRFTVDIFDNNEGPETLSLYCVLDEDQASNWSNWSNWNACACEGSEANQQRRVRECISSLDNGITDCEGFSSESRACIANNCEG